jgi:hypothetical protein
MGRTSISGRARAVRVEQVSGSNVDRVGVRAVRSVMRGRKFFHLPRHPYGNAAYCRRAAVGNEGLAAPNHVQEMREKAVLTTPENGAI